MSIALKCFVCDSWAVNSDGFCASCYIELFSDSDGALSVARKLTGVIVKSVQQKQAADMEIARLGAVLEGVEVMRAEAVRMGCQSTNHVKAACHGELWQCTRCQRVLCYADGCADADFEICDTCTGRFATPEKNVMTIDYRERYPAAALVIRHPCEITSMRNDLISAIDELRSTITAQQDAVGEIAKMLEQAHDEMREMDAALEMGRDAIADKDGRIAGLEAQLSEAQTIAEERLGVLRRRNTDIAVLQARVQAQSDTINELKAQLAAALATIERAL